MNCATTRYSTAAMAMVPSITRPQSLAYRQAERHEPVTRKPASGTMASMMAR